MKNDRSIDLGLSGYDELFMTEQTPVSQRWKKYR